MKRIREESDLFADRHEALRLDYAFTEFFLVSSIYYYYLQQRQEAIDLYRNIQEDEALSDTNQLALLSLSQRIGFFGRSEYSGRTESFASLTNFISHGGQP